jgi:enoyl-CoA hydratase/carnithine racemase
MIRWIDAEAGLEPALRALARTDDVRAAVLALDGDADGGAGALLALRAVPQPVVAAIRGACREGAFELALACDLRLAADDATLAADPAALGTAIRLTRPVGEARAKDLVLTGRAVGAADAVRLGVVTRVVPAATLVEQARATAELIASRAPLAVRAVKQALGRARDLTPAEALALEHDEFARLVTSGDHREAVAAFFARRPPVFTGA